MTKPDELSKRITAIREKIGGSTYNEILEVYLEGYSDGYDKAIVELTKEWGDGLDD
jgi:hypothetical protein